MTGSTDEDGYLVLASDKLVAVLVRLSEEVHGDAVGNWYLEVGFGPCDGPAHPVFETLDAAKAWIATRLPPT
jgi:hypothetical protein